MPTLFHHDCVSKHGAEIEQEWMRNVHATYACCSKRISMVWRGQNYVKYGSERSTMIGMRGNDDSNNDNVKEVVFIDHRNMQDIFFLNIHLKSSRYVGQYCLLMIHQTLNWLEHDFDIRQNIISSWSLTIKAGSIHKTCWVLGSRKKNGVVLRRATRQWKNKKNLKSSICL